MSGIKVKVSPRNEIQVRSMNFGRRSSIGDLKDVDLTGLQDGDLLRYDATSEKFEAYTAPVQNIFKNITDGTNTAVADANSDTLKFRGNADVSVVVTDDDNVHGDNVAISLTAPYTTISGRQIHLGDSIQLDEVLNMTTEPFGLVKRSNFNTLVTAVSSVDYAPATVGSAILYGNNAGGFSQVIVDIATGVSFIGGHLLLQNIPNTAISNAQVTIAGTAIPLGGSITLDAIDDAISVNGFIARDAANSRVTRTITGTAGQITVTDGDGVSGPPTISLPATITQATTFSAPTLSLLPGAAAARLAIGSPNSSTSTAITFATAAGSAASPINQDIEWRNYAQTPSGRIRMQERSTNFARTIFDFQATPTGGTVASVLTIDGGGSIGNGIVTVVATTASSSTTTGALVVNGGIGVAGAGYLGGNLTFGTSSSVLNGTTGSIGLYATGSNQDIKLVPTGTGRVLVGSVATPSDLFQVEGVSASIKVRNTDVAAGTYIKIDRPANARNSSIIHSLNGTTEWVTGVLYNSGSASTGYAISTDSTLTNAKLFIGTGGNVLLGTTTDSSNGKLQLAVATTNAGGIGFGTDTAFFRNGTRSVRLEGMAAGATQLDIGNFGNSAWNLVTEVGNAFRLKQDGTVALTFASSSRDATFASTTAATSTSTGAVIVAGGVGIAGALHVGGSVNFAGTIATGDNITITKVSQNGAVTVNRTTTNPSSIAIQANSDSAAIRYTGANPFAIYDGTTNWFTLAPTTGNATFPSSTVSSSTTTGAVVITGGLGIGGVANIGGNTNVGGNLVVTGDLTVNGTTTTINTATLAVEDKNIELAVGSVTDVAADGGGITLKGATDKTLNWIDATDAWTSSEHVNLAAGKQYLLADKAALGLTEVTTTSVTADQVLVNLSSTTYRTAKFVIQAVNTTTGFFQSVEIMAIQNGSTAAHVEYASISIGGNVATFNVLYSSGISLVCTPAAASSTVFRVFSTAVKV